MAAVYFVGGPLFLMSVCTWFVVALGVSGRLGVWLFCALAAVAVSFTWGTWWAVPCALLPLVGALGLLDRFTPTPSRVKVG